MPAMPAIGWRSTSCVSVFPTEDDRSFSTAFGHTACDQVPFPKTREDCSSSVREKRCELALREQLCTSPPRCSRKTGLDDSTPCKQVMRKVSRRQVVVNQTPARLFCSFFSCSMGQRVMILAFTIVDELSRSGNAGRDVSMHPGRT